MKLLLLYGVRNLATRRLTTFLTAFGMALVVFVFASILMLSEGLEKALVETGRDDNVIVTRKASNSEVQSGIERSQAAIVESIGGIGSSVSGGQLLAKELVVLITLPKREGNKPSNVVIRGISDASLELRPQVIIAEGRMPKPGSSEIMAGRNIAAQFRGGGLGETLRFGMRDWQVVGVFDSGATGFSSEIWGDSAQLMQAFRRPVYSSITFRMQDPASFGSIKSLLESDPRLTVEVRRETRYYKDQSEAMSKFLKILGISLTVIFSIGAMIGAMITMYASVANRVPEIGTLRVLGFSRSAIVGVFLAESLFLGLAGGTAGLLFASLMQFFSISTMNWQTFSELAFSFTLTPGILAMSLLFSVIMGLFGGVLPSIRAGRMNIVDTFR